MKTLVLFSGGTDSTYVLYKLLTETDDEVTALTLERTEDLGIKGLAGPPESNLRIPKLVEELKKIRNFTHIKKIVTKDEINEETDHYYTYGITWAAPFLNDETYDRLATGRTWEQHDQNLFKNTSIRGTPALLASKRLFKKLTTRGELWNPLATHEYHDKFNKWHIFKYLPKNLLQFTFSCDQPIVCDDGSWNERCYECYKCLWDEKVLEMIDQGYNDVQIDSYRRLKSLQYGHKGKSAPMRFWLPIEMGKGVILRDLDTKEKVQEFIEKKWHYTLLFRSEKGIWDFSDFSDLEDMK
jgi:hypothetical protein